MFRKEDLIVYGIVGVGLYILYKKLAPHIPDLPQIGANVGGALYEWINPYPGQDMYYTVTFPDGSRHTVHSTDVSNTGAFSYGGQNYLLKTNAAGQRVAVTTGIFNSIIDSLTAGAAAGG